jgi:hypothetical protein
MGMILGFTIVKRIIAEKNYCWKELELIYIGNTQIPILEFE